MHELHDTHVHMCTIHSTLDTQSALDILNQEHYLHNVHHTENTTCTADTDSEDADDGDDGDDVKGLELDTH